MGLDNAPALREANPDLALPATHEVRAGSPFKFQRNACKIAAETDDIESLDSARQIRCRPRLPECLQLFRTIKILGNPESHDLWSIPKHFDQFFHIIRHQRPLVLRVERLEFCDNFRIVDGHRRGNSSWEGRICLLSAPLIVYIGSLTTWLSRNFNATLQSRYACTSLNPQRLTSSSIMRSVAARAV